MKRKYTYKKSSIKYQISLLLVLFSMQIYAQNKEYAYSIVDTLTQASYGGRAYDGSDLKAAGFIAGEMKRIGLSPVGNSYFQHFPLAINSIKEVNISLNDKKLIAGKEYLTLLSSPSLQGTFQTMYMPADSNGKIHLIKNPSVYKEIFVATDLSPQEFKKQFNLDVRGIIYLKEKAFFWHISDGREVSDKVEIYLKKELFTADIETITIDLKTQFQTVYMTQNVLGIIKGTRYPDQYIFITAHYDHLGRMGKETFFPGGHDNASGTAMVLDLAHYYAKHPSAYSLVFVLFSGEEAGLLGSFHYVKHPLISLKKTKFVLNLDLMGAGSEGIMVVNGKEYPKYFKKLKKINRCRRLLPQIKARGKAANSDHYPFSQMGVPAFFFYTLGDESTEYHSPGDNLSNVHFSDYEDLFKLIITFVKKI